VSDCFQVVSAGLLDALVGVDGGVSCGAGEVLAVLVGNVLSLTVFITLCQSEVNDVNLVFGLVSPADQEVVRLDVAVDNALFVNFLDPHKLHQSERAPISNRLTICLAISSTVLRSNERLQD
jgi:hypothetical protein